MPDLDLPFIRAQFPAFSTPALQGQAFFENAGGSYTCRQVIDRLTRFYTERKVQPYGSFEASRLGGAEMDEAQARLGALMAVTPDWVSFGPSTTQNVYVLAQAFAEHLQAGDAIIVTNQDHEANTGAWRRLAERGITVREWQIDPETGLLDLLDLADLLDEKAKLLCFPHCSNVIGAINPVADICRLAQANGTLTCVDGVSYAPHGWPHIPSLGADIYLFSAYKTFGPHQGIMLMNPDLAHRLPNQGHYFNASSATKRLTPAGPDHAQVAASAGMVDYAEAVFAAHIGGAADLATKGQAVHDLFRAHETGLTERVLAYLSGKNTVRVLGPLDAAQKAPTIALHPLTQSAEGLANRLSEDGIMAGASDFYAVRALEALGLNPDEGVLRLSFLHYTSDAEVDQLLKALDKNL